MSRAFRDGRIEVLGACFLIAAGIEACGAPAMDEPSAAPPLEEESLAPDYGDRIQALNRDLVPGAIGDEVRTVQTYLKQYGYFPNSKLARKFPVWRPIVPNAPRDGVFDEHTAVAIRELQRVSGLAVTGIVDAPTREVIKEVRCGVPEGMPTLDASNKFSLNGDFYTGSTFYWWGDGGGTPQSGADIRAWDSWRDVTSINPIMQSNWPVTDVSIEWESFGPNGDFAVTSHDSLGNYTIEVNQDRPYFMGPSTTVPVGFYDYQSVIAHEFGHVLGLGHSSICSNCLSPPVMRPGAISGSSRKRTPKTDDRVAVSIVWDTWTWWDGGSTDVGAGLYDGDTIWVTADDHSVWRFASGWTRDASNPDAGRIAVDNTGRPWVIAGWGDGTIWRRSSSDPNSGTWQEIPGAGCARDIGIGLEGGNTAAWIIGCENGNDSRIYKWKGAGWALDVAQGLASRITVDETGIPWVLGSGGDIWRRTMTDPYHGTWEYRGTINTAKDISVSAGNYVRVVTSNGYVYVLDEQPSYPNTPAITNQWWFMYSTVPGGGANIAVSGNNDPWVINPSNVLYKTTK